MHAPSVLNLSEDRHIAYHKTEAKGEGVGRPGVVFLGGFKSDMEGTKALALEDWAKARGRAFLRFDYTGHGQSSGNFEAGSIGDWARDAADTLAALTDGPQVLVGSSMGGWISLILIRSGAVPLAGFVGIAAAPDFTEDSMWAGMDEATRARLLADGRIEEPSEYSDDPYVITRRLIEDGREQLVLRNPLPISAPVRLFQGTADVDVEMSVALRLLDHIDGADVRLTMVKGADHRFSGPEELALLTETLDAL